MMTVGPAGLQQQSSMVQDAVQVKGRYSTLIPNVARKMSRMALALIALYAVANIPGADAGPAAYAACVAACGGLPWCWPICWPAMLAPTL